MLNGIVKEVPRGSAEFHMVANKQSRGQRSGANPLYNIHNLERERERERERGKIKRKYVPANLKGSASNPELVTAEGERGEQGLAEVVVVVGECCSLSVDNEYID